MWFKRLIRRRGRLDSSGCGSSVLGIWHEKSPSRQLAWPAEFRRGKGVYHSKSIIPCSVAL
jgi:hypothetical protein